VELPPAAAVEAEFHDRWVAQRAHELLGAGTAKTEDEAKAMAAAEFAKQYPFIRLRAAKSTADSDRHYSLRIPRISISKTSVARRGIRGDLPGAIAEFIGHDNQPLLAHPHCLSASSHAAISSSRPTRILNGLARSRLSPNTFPLSNRP